MADLSPDVAWYQKYRPREIADLVFENENHKVSVERWLADGAIDGNLLLFGHHGKGKTTLSRILIEKLIKNKADLFRMVTRSVKEIDEMANWIKAAPKSGKKKIAFIEEFDKISGTALSTLKDTLMEDFQSTTSFICTTNHYNNIPAAVLDRFNHQFSFDGKNADGVKTRLEYILKVENAKYDPVEFESFVATNGSKSFRRIISYLQESYISNNGLINFAQLEKSLNLEQSVTDIFRNMIIEVMKMPNPRDRKMSLNNPMESPIAKDYQTFVTIIHNNYDINYTSIFEGLYDKIKYVPIRLIIADYYDKSDYKKWAHVNLIGCFYECLKCANEVLM